MKLYAIIFLLFAIVPLQIYAMEYPEYSGKDTEKYEEYIDPNTRYQNAIRSNDVDEIKRAIKEGANPNQPAPYNALIYAVAIGDYDLIRFLIAHGADPDYKPSRNSVSPREYVLQNAPQEAKKIFSIFYGHSGKKQRE